MENPTDEPSNIKWENIPYSTTKRRIRKVISFFIALIVIFASFGIVIGNKYAMDGINSIYNSNINCNYIDYTNSQVQAEFTNPTIPSRSKVKTYCYCQNTLFREGYTNTKNITLDKGVTYPCQEWVNMYLYSQSLMIGTFILVPLINVLLSILLSLLTKCERNKSVALMEGSSMWKNFFLQLINTAVVILTVNIYIKTVYDWDSSFPLFTGIFKDFDPYWFSSVGVTIIFCMILNVVTPHIAPLFAFTMTSLMRGCDRGCCTNGKKTKIGTRQEYLELYTGPEFDIGTRYSQSLCTIFVCLIYSSGMPIMYVCCFLYFLVCFWVDKWLILKFYKSPPQIDLSISKMFDLMIIFAMIVHYGCAIWTYGNSNILTDNSNTAIKVFSDWVKNFFNFSQNSFAQEILNRITYSYNIICFVFLLLLVMYFIWRLFFVDFLLKQIFKCFKKNYTQVKDVCIYDSISIRGLYSNHQLRKAQYFKMRKHNGTFEMLKESYFRKMINEDRSQIKRRLTKLTGDDFEQVKNINFDSEIPPIMKSLVLKEDAPINRNFSYNITYIPQFRDVAYYEFIVPYLSKDQ